MLHVNSGYKTNPSLIFSIFSRPMVPLKLESQAFSNLNFSFWGPLSRPSSSHLTAPALRHPLLTPSDSLLTVNNNNSFIFFIFYFSFPLVSHSWGWERLLLFFYTFTHTWSATSLSSVAAPLFTNQLNCLSLQFILPLWIHSFTTLLLEC